MGSIPILVTSEIVGTPTGDTKLDGNDLVSQTMLRVLERMVGARTGPIAWGSVTERLRSNEVELFRGVTRVTPIIAEYWLPSVS